MATPDEHEKIEDTRVKEPINSIDRLQTRRCHSCGDTMRAKAQESEYFVHPGREKGIRFACDSCRESAWIASNETIIISIASGLLIALIIVYMIANGLFDFVIFSFKSDISSGLLSLLLLLVVTLFGFGAIYTIHRGLCLIKANRQYPLADAPDRSKAILITLTLGLTPWLLVGGIGYINYRYFNDNEVVGVIGIAIAATPLFFASNLGSSLRKMLLAMVFWLIIGGIGTWLIGALYQ